MSPALSQVVLNQRDMAKQLLTPLRLIARMNVSLKYYDCELFNLIGTVGKVELINNYPWIRLSSRIIEAIKRQLFHVVTHVFYSNLSQEIFAIDTWRAVNTRWDMVAHTCLRSFRLHYMETRLYITSFNNMLLTSEFLRAEGNGKYAPRLKSDYTSQTIATKLFINKYTQGIFPEQHQLNIWMSFFFFIFTQKSKKF